MTEDRANQACAQKPGEGSQSLAWWGIQRIAAVWKGGLKMAGNGPVSEFCQGVTVVKGATGSRCIERLKVRRKRGVSSGERRDQTGEKKPRTRRGFFIRLIANTGA
ncbi:hypothetical protein [Paraburkholderia sp. D1E]|uniref:hypothetical protein n=1 Tax=Paraburkholderia sp. D1E TaxID=3461398 RepID=UPI004045DB66